MRGLHAADIAVIALYLVGVALIGVRSGRGLKLSADFFMPRRFGKFMMVMFSLTIVFSFLLLPFLLNAVGGMAGIRATIDDPARLSLVAPQEIGLFYITVIAVNALLGVVTQPHAMGNCAAGRTEMDGRVGFMFGNVTKRICTIPWALIGLAAIVYFGQAGRTVEPDKIFGTVAGEFLPRVLPGLLGVFIASLLASVMSSCDAFMISASALFTQNIYRKLVPTHAERHYLTVGRIASVAVVAAGVAFAYWLPGIVAGLEIFWKISAMTAIPFWLGLFWRRATVAGAWAATLVSFAVWFGTTRLAGGVLGTAGRAAPTAPAGGTHFELGAGRGRFEAWGRGKDTRWFAPEFLPALFERKLVLDDANLEGGQLEWIFTGERGGFTVSIDSAEIYVSQRFYDSPGFNLVAGENPRHPQWRTRPQSARHDGVPREITVALDHKLGLAVHADGRELVRQECLFDVSRHQLRLSGKTVDNLRVAGRLVEPPTRTVPVTVDPGRTHQKMIGFGGITTPTAYAQLSPRGKQRWWELLCEYNLLIQREYPIGSRLSEAMDNWDNLADATPHYYGDKPFLSTELCVNNSKCQWPTYRLALLMGQLYHKNLVLADAVALCYCWTLLNVEQPSYGWTRSLCVPDAKHGFVPVASSHQLRVFGAYSRRIREGMRRVSATSSDDDLLVCAFQGVGSAATGVLLNRGTAVRRARIIWPAVVFSEFEVADPYRQNELWQVDGISELVIAPGAVVTVTNVALRQFR